MKKYLSIALCLMLFLTGCDSAPADAPSSPGADLIKDYTIPKDPENYPEGYQPKYLTREEMVKDLDTMVHDLETKHINPYHDISKENFHFAVEVLKDNLKGMNADQFYYEVTRLVALIGESHSVVQQNDAGSLTSYLFPYELLSFDHEWYLNAISKEYAEYIGWRVDRISRYNREELVQRLSPYISHDNEVWLNARLLQYIKSWNILYYTGITTDSSLVLELSQGTEHKTITLSAMAMEEWNQDNLELLEYEKAVTFPEDPYYTYLNLDDILLIQYNQCAEDPDEPMKDFVEEIRPLLEGRRCCAVDLRYNSGGNSSILDPLINLLAKYNDNGNKLYVFIGEDTFSSGILNAVSLQKYAKATLIGTPTGGSANGYGEVKSFELPNSKLYVTYCEKFFQPTDRGINPVQPDIQVTHTLSDFVNGVDPELKVLEQQLE